MSYQPKKSLILLYQVGIANVFEELRKKPYIKRLLQSDFRTCEQFCRGAQFAGAGITLMHWDHAGDAAQHVASWEDGVGEIFAESKGFVAQGKVEK
jgi:hypothetical protein